jgi:hypothetical protein
MTTTKPPAPNVTNVSTKFAPFSLTLTNGATTTGISHIPAVSPAPIDTLPLIIGIHGGTCTAHNFDIDPSHTAYLASYALSIPFVAFNRPSYLDSNPTHIPADSSFHRETGKWEHEFIFPALWEKFGKPNGCSGIVLLCHSMAVPGAIVAASMWAKDASPKYPLAGLIFSGWGTTGKKQESMPQRQPDIATDGTIRLTPLKKLLMLSEDKYNAFFPEMVPLVLVQDAPFPLAEYIDGTTQWMGYGPGYAKDVNVPM